MALTKQGLAIKRLTELKKEYDQRLTEAFGPINTEADSVIGQLQGIWAEAMANMYEQLQDTYHAMYPSSAEGSSLDGAVSYVGITRFAASATQVIAAVYGRESSLLAKGALASDGDQRYRATADCVISRANAIDVEMKIKVQDNSRYALNINGKLLEFTSRKQATAAQIIAGFAGLLAGSKLSCQAQGDKLRIFATNGITPFAISLGDLLTFSRIGSPAHFMAEETGRKVLPAGALNQIVTPRSGWEGISNLVAGNIGQERESDAELRLRFEHSRHTVGSATVKAIRARLLQEVLGLSEVRIFENRSNLPSADSIPPHALEALVVGGDAQQIARSLWTHKPAGIETYGSSEVLVYDENGDGQLIRFSRPTLRYAWVRVHVAELYDEEQLPSDIINGIKQAVLQQGQRLAIGEDIIVQRFLGPIYASTSGLGQLTLSIAVSDEVKEGKQPAWQRGNIAIDRRSIALFDLQRIEVTGL